MAKCEQCVGVDEEMNELIERVFVDGILEGQAALAEEFLPIIKSIKRLLLAGSEKYAEVLVAKMELELDRIRLEGINGDETEGDHACCH